MHCGVLLLGSLVCCVPSQIAASFAESPCEKKYVVAVDTANSTLAEVVTAVSSSLGPGAVRVMDRAEVDNALVTNSSLADLQVDMAFDVDESVVGGLGIDWTAQGGFVENCDAVMQEYIKTRNLLPVRLLCCVAGARECPGCCQQAGVGLFVVPCLLHPGFFLFLSPLLGTCPDPAFRLLQLRIALMGPPASGKTALATALAKHYYIPHITAASALAQVREADSELAAEVNTAIAEAGDGRLATGLFCKAVRSVLEAPKLRNRGYVLDGLPRTFQEAKLLFAEVGEDEEESKGDEDEVITVVPTSLPTAVVMLAGDAEVFSARIKAIPQAQVEGTHNTEEDFARRTKRYNEGNAPEDPRATIVFFENQGGLDTLTLNVEAGSSVEALQAAAVPYIEQGGTPYNYHPTEEELAAVRAAAEAKAEAEAAAKAAAEEARVAEEQRVKAEREAEEQRRMAQIAKQEAQLLEARSAPLRNYLMENVIPTLTQGLLEVTKVEPEDPVDFLAEFLFRNSPNSDGSEYEAKLKASHK